VAVRSRHEACHVVLASSVAAVGTSATASEQRGEAHWSSETRRTGVERRAWELAAELSVPITVLCPAPVLGPHDFRLMPATRYLLDLALGRAVTFGGGGNWVDVRDVADAFERAVVQRPVNQRYVLGGDNVDLRDLGRMIGALTGAPPRHVPIPPRLLAPGLRLLDGARRALAGSDRSGVETAVVAGRYAYYRSAKAQHDLDFRPRALGETLADTLRWLAHAGHLSDRGRAGMAHRLAPELAS
jgi:dihydroflavonol-4-reductase